jgi:hypothetical protein
MTDDENGAEPSDPADTAATVNSTGEKMSARYISKASIEAFRDHIVIHNMTALQVAEHRMAAASVLLARLWLSVFQEAKVSGCETQPFNELASPTHYVDFLSLVLRNYPYPDYVTDLMGHKKSRPHATIKKIH